MSELVIDLFYQGKKVSFDQKGYPSIWLDGRNARIHLLEWERHFGPKPKGHDVHHYPEPAHARGLGTAASAVARGGYRESVGRLPPPRPSLFPYAAACSSFASLASSSATLAAWRAISRRWYAASRHSASS